MATGKPRQARCRQGRVIIADERIHLKSLHGLSRRPRWTVARAQVRDLVPRSGHGVTINLVILSQDGRELHLDWLLPHDAVRVAAALGYEWTIARMRELAAVHTLGEAAAFALAPDAEPTFERPRVVVRPAVITVPLADTTDADTAPRVAGVARLTPRLTVPLSRLTPRLTTIAARSSTGATVALTRARAGLASASARARTGLESARGQARAMARRPVMETVAVWLVALTAWLGAQARRLRAVRLPRPTTPYMKLLYLALLASLIVISSAGWLWAGGGSSSHHSAKPPSNLVQVYGGLPPVIVTTPTPTPTIAPTSAPIVPPTPIPQPTATPLPQPTPTPLPATLTVTFTCAWAQVFVRGQICVHTQPFATLALTITYCGGDQATGAVTLHARVSADANGDYTWTFVPKTRCVGPARATVTANWQGQTATASTTFIVKP